MANILMASVMICGTRALLFNRFTVDALPLEKQERGGVPGRDPDEWKRTVQMTQDRQLYLMRSQLFGCLRDGGKYTTRKRGTLQTYVAATLEILTDTALLDRYVPAEPLPTDSEQPVYLDVQAVRNPATKARNIRYRVAAAVGWRVHFDLMWDKTILNSTEMQTVILDAGRFVGIGDGRGIGFGRFQLEAFEVQDA